MTRELACKVSQHAVRNLKYNVFGTLNDILVPSMREAGIDPSKVAWSSSSELVRAPDGRKMTVYTVRGKELT